MSATSTGEKVKELRERTGVGMAKCKEALEQSGGDIEKAIDYLRKAGLAGAVKKEGRETKEGLIGIGESKTAFALVELNAETDFVTKNEKFKEFLHQICQDAAEGRPSSLEVFMAQKNKKDPVLTNDEYRASLMQSLGENIKVKRLKIIPKSSDLSIGVYSHMGSKIVCVVELTGGEGQEALAREIAMHAAAESPEYLVPEEVPQDVKAREEEIARCQVKDKPANIMDKIIAGKLKAFYDQVCLLCQKFVKDDTMTIAQLLEKESKRLNKKLGVKQFMRWKVGA